MRNAIEQLARQCTIELNVQDLHELSAIRELLPPGKKVYVSHLPKQTWVQTLEACRAVVLAGFDPVPHIPVRLLENERALDDLLAEAIGRSHVQEVLLISGDYPQAAGAYSTVSDVLRTGKLSDHGLARVSLAGHPEGHPTVSSEEIRRAELEKAKLAAEAGLSTTFVTQFFFEVQPFVTWAHELREAGVSARLVAGLPGPAGLGALLRLAKRCGVGPSIRALGSRPSSLIKLAVEHSPDVQLQGLASEWQARPGLFDGVHLFSLGGLVRTVEWLLGASRN